MKFEVKKVHYHTVFETITDIYKNEGPRAFSRGIIPRMMINIPSTALSWGTYEIVKGFLKDK
jgi:solute carrier family 25 (mitochondrial iron transporter), member 28/37